MLLTVPGMNIQCDTEVWDSRFIYAGLHGLCVPIAICASNRYGANTTSLYANIDGKEIHVHTMMRIGNQHYDVSSHAPINYEYLLQYYHHILLQHVPTAQNISFYYVDNVFTMSNAAYHEQSLFPNNPLQVSRYAIEEMVSTMMSIWNINFNYHVYDNVA